MASSTGPGPEACEAPDSARWNHNAHYHRVILDAIPDRARRALDVGCGEGTMTRALRARVPVVTGIDPDAASIDLARRQGPTDVDYVVGDVLTHGFPDAVFDVVACVTALHHMEAAAALRRMAALVRPGGVVAVIGVARRRVPQDLPRDLLGVAVSRTLRLRRKEWTTPAPKVWPPPQTFPEVRRTAAEILPGVRFRRHVLWRYSLVWARPACPTGYGDRGVPPAGG